MKNINIEPPPMNLTPPNDPQLSDTPLESVPPISSTGRRRTGKVALLPKTIRDKINVMLEDGVPYDSIIENLNAPGAPPLLHPINKHHLSEWKDGGYQDWLKNRFWEDEMRARHEVFSGLLLGDDSVRLPEGGLQFATIGLCELLRDLSSARSGDDSAPDQYVHEANTLARLSRAILQLQQYRDVCAKARATVQGFKDPKRKLTEDETRAIVRKVDEILGLAPRGPSPFKQ